jgi:hypothetical protein
MFTQNLFQVGKETVVRTNPINLIKKYPKISEAAIYIIIGCTENPNEFLAENKYGERITFTKGE